MQLLGQSANMTSTSGFGRRGVATVTGGAPREYRRAPEPKPVREPALGHVENLLFSLDGRISRMQYWIGKLGAAISYISINVLARALTGALTRSQTAHANSPGFLLVSVIALLALLVLLVLTFWVSFALQVKRWHDRDKSWAWALLGFIPIIGLWQFIECGFMEGTPGPNRFGQSPRGVIGGAYEDYYA